MYPQGRKKSLTFRKRVDSALPKSEMEKVAYFSVRLLSFTPCLYLRQLLKETSLLERKLLQVFSTIQPQNEGITRYIKKSLATTQKFKLNVQFIK